MRAVRSAKKALKEAFPSLWLEWHFMRRPKSAEVELGYLKNVIPSNAITVDVGANRGLYTRELARCSKHVHAFEPTKQMADLLRRTSASNVQIHEIAISDRDGVATLSVPLDGDQAVHSLASIEQRTDAETCAMETVRTARLDSAVKDDVAFVKVDVEGHELHVLKGATGVIERSRPVFLVEAEERHSSSATASVFEFFKAQSYRGFFILDGEVKPISEFDPRTMQDTDSLLPNGGRKEGQPYINNFFFFPDHMDGMTALLG
ncbi:FkbM family methyltransferase [Bradyrhizobium sp. LHD-71]|uniref:FkbM family methyltransferase n=1 Tax=Bradyrhizobium sp. LHD-71 TaxID=3072141 RepID=UPI00280FEC91|nr:FkbM family methyltransferase [Bradyrhizobium sp. LHD-71]MDQ8729780.1 FkbM family methyltransferase [Bradyrhizobium sp. LHD-71]